MNTIRIWVFSALLLSLPTAQAEAKTPEPKSFTLANGMQVVAIPDHRAPVVTHMVWYKVGAADEPAGKSGIAHLFEHLMFKEAGDIPAGEFSRIIARNGGKDNAFTSQDYTAYFQRVAKDRLPLVMDMEKTRMTQLRLSDEEVLPERDVVKEERRQRIGNNPRSQLFEKVLEALYIDHPYGIPVIGYMPEVAALSREDALDFYARWYGPENAILIVAGDITIEELRPLAERIYGSIPRKNGIERPDWPSVQDLPASRTIIHEDPKVRQPEYFQVWLGLDITDPDRHALSVAMHLLGGGRTSYLFQNLVDEKKLAVSAYAFANSDSIARGYVGAGLVPAPGVDPETLREAFEAALSQFLKTPPNAQDLERAKSSLIAASIYARDNQASMANWFGSSLARGMDIKTIMQREDRLRAVTARDVLRVTRRLINDNSSAISALLLPKEKS